MQLEDASWVKRGCVTNDDQSMIASREGRERGQLLEREGNGFEDGEQCVSRLVRQSGEAGG